MPQTWQRWINFILGWNCNKANCRESEALWKLPGCTGTCAWRPHKSARLFVQQHLLLDVTATTCNNSLHDQERPPNTHASHSMTFFLMTDRQINTSGNTLDGDKNVVKFVAQNHVFIRRCCLTSKPLIIAVAYIPCSGITWKSLSKTAALEANVKPRVGICPQGKRGSHPVGSWQLVCWHLRWTADNASRALMIKV